MDALFIYGTNQSLVYHRAYGETKDVNRVKEKVRSIVFDRRKDTFSTSIDEMVNVLWIERDFLVYCALVSKDVQPLAILAFLKRINEALRIYCGPQPLNEISLQKHFSSFFLAVDEMCYEGSPSTELLSFLLMMLQQQNTVNSAKKAVAKSNKAVAGFLNNLGLNFATSTRLLKTDQQDQTTQLQPVCLGTSSKGMTQSGLENWWRRGDVTFMRNELYVDICEQFSTIVDRHGNLLQNSVAGTIQLSAHMSGTPHCILRLRSADAWESFGFHAGVKSQDTLREPKADKELRFLPEDGIFPLATYAHSARSIRSPIKFHGSVTVQKTSLTLHLDISGGMLSKKDRSVIAPAEVVQVRILLPGLARSFTHQCSTGAVVLAPNKSVLFWHIRLLARSTQRETAEITILFDTVPTSNCGLVAEVSFVLNGAVLTNIEVDSLRIENVDYEPYKGCRYSLVGNCEYWLT